MFVSVLPENIAPTMSCIDSVEVAEIGVPVPQAPFSLGPNRRLLVVSKYKLPSKPTPWPGFPVPLIVLGSLFGLDGSFNSCSVYKLCSLLLFKSVALNEEPDAKTALAAATSVSL